MARWLLVLAGYVIGACPTAYLFGQRLKGKDIRQLGDGNMGARNAYHELGHKTGILIFFIDAAKGSLAVFVHPVSCPAIHHLNRRRSRRRRA